MQEWIVALIVMIAATTVVRKYLPASLRQKLTALVVPWLYQARLPGIAGWLTKNRPVSSTCGDGCANCGSCGTDQSQTATSAKQFTITPAALKQTIHRS